jgi:cytochrome c-type biogenesis protein CcmH
MSVIFLIVAAFMAAIAATAVALPLLRNRQSRILGAVAGVLVMGSAAALYPLWSNFDWRAPRDSRAVGADALAMVAKLEAHMKEAPHDLEGWLLLGRSYLALDRVDDAIAAYDHAHRLDSGNAEAMLGLGEAMSERAGGNVTPQAIELFERAVALEPDNPRALLYSGFGAATRGDRAVARDRWLKLEAMHPPPEVEAVLDQRIAELGTSDLAGTDASIAGAGAGVSGAGVNGAGTSASGAGASGAGVKASSGGPNGAGTNASGTVANEAQATLNLSIAPALKSQLRGDVPLFVFAREVGGGQGPPLAAKRLTSAALGSQIHLSAADSLMPGRALAAGQKVSITARISFSGRPLPAAGDLYGELTYDVGHDGARDLVIDRIAQ